MYYFQKDKNGCNTGNLNLYSADLISISNFKKIIN